MDSSRGSIAGTWKNRAVAFVFLMASAGVFAQSRPIEIPKPQDMAATDFYLMTVGLGPDTYMRYGHTMIRVHDRVRNLEYDFNWGIFDFSDPLFALNFFRGIQIYRLGVSSSASTTRHYGTYERRKVWQDKINLTDRQKQALIDRIFWNLEPANLTYQYQHFYNNCSTKPRDYLDEVLGGRIKSRYQGIPGSKKYRDYVVENLNRPIAASFSLDIVMNSKIDGEMSAWEEMFYPEKLRELLLALPALDDQGAELPNTALLSESRLVVHGPDYPSSAINPFALFSLLMGTPLMIVLAAQYNRLRRGQRPSLRIRRIFGAWSMAWGIFAGSFGLIMLLSWIFSRHLDILHNANLWLLWPIDFFFLPIGWRLVRGCEFSDLPAQVWGLARRLAAFHLVAGIIFTAAKLFYWIDQNVWNVLIYVLPVASLYYAGILRLAASPERESQLNV